MILKKKFELGSPFFRLYVLATSQDGGVHSPIPVRKCSLERLARINEEGDGSLGSEERVKKANSSSGLNKLPDKRAFF